MGEEATLNFMRTFALILGFCWIGLSFRFWSIRKDREREGNIYHGMLPSWVAVTWIASAVVLCYEIIEKYDAPLGPTTPLATAVFLTGISSLLKVLSVESK